MADLDELKRALIKADEAGNAEDAKMLADAIRAAGPQRRSPLQSAGHYAGLIGRGAIKGIVGSAEQLIPPIYPPGSVGRGLVEKIDPSVEKGMTAVGLPEPQTTPEKIVTGASELLPGLVGGKGIRGKPRPIPMEGEALRNSARNAIIDAAKDEGYVLPGQTTLASIGQMIAGKTPTKAAMAIRNQEVTNKIARREAGLAEDIPITDQNLAAAREKMSGPYNEVAEVSPKAKSALKSLKQTRVDARNQWRFYNSFGSQGYANPAVKKAAESLDRKADFYESIIENEAVKIAQEQMKLAKPRGAGGRFISPMEEGRKLGQSLVEDLREARTKLAKNYQVDRANTPGGNIDAKSIAREKGMKTGGLKLISDFEIERRPAFGVEMDLEPQLHMGGGIGLHHLGLGAWSRGIPLVGPAGRAMAMSKLGQGGRTRTSLRDINPALLMAPGLGLRMPEQEE